MGGHYKTISFLDFCRRPDQNKINFVKPRRSHNKQHKVIFFIIQMIFDLLDKIKFLNYTISIKSKTNTKTVFVQLPLCLLIIL